MDTYSVLRAFADSWMLIVMFGFFLGCVIWAFRPGSTQTYRDSANIVFRNEDQPARDDSADADVAAIKEAWK